jgi:hypothetical protein
LAPIGLPVVTISSAFCDAGDARQPLRPAGAGQQAELDLGHAELRVGHRDPIMAAERDLEPAAERGAVDRRDHRLGAILDRVDHLGSHGITGGLPNSVMSAPAKKVWPSQRITTALIASSASASSIAATSPWRTARRAR